ncbi:MAG: carboxypeptidase regulatory-like domain-containing protein, partial [Pseudomonadota bacterium]
MSNWKLLSGVAAASMMTAAIIAPAEAQVTTSEVSGSVVAEDGTALSNALITVTNTSTGLTRTTRTSSTGFYSIRSLPVGPGYSVTATAEGFQGRTVENVALALGDTARLQFALTADDARTLDTIVVTASAADIIQTAVGPNATFGIETLQNAPASNRSITDVLRFDPRIYVDESQGDINPVQCGGKNPRFNSLTLDGVRLNDGFGLNSNGFPTERQPFPFDAIEQVAVELAPFDVEYGGFTACNINAVTKSGRVGVLLGSRL